MFRPWCISVPILFAVCGCGGSSVSPVTGTLLVDGQPAARANIYFRSTDPKVLTCPVALTDQDGTFRLMTNAIENGARPGNYIVTLFWWDPENPYDDCSGNDVIQHDILRGRYMDARLSPLRATVQSGNNHIVIEAEKPKASTPSKRAKKVELVTPSDSNAETDSKANAGEDR